MHDRPWHSTSEHEDVVFARCAGVEVVIAIHSTTLGPALGGLRAFPYASAYDGVVDALRLARAMTAKAAAAGLDLGGGKSVAVGDPAEILTPAMLNEFGELIEQLGGRYIVAEDVGTTVQDIEVVARRTAHVAGRADQSGDPSPWTARGVFRAMEAVGTTVLASPSLAGLRIGIIGVGKVGRALAGLAVDAGAQVMVADPAPAAVQAVRQQHPSVGVVDVAAALTEPVDILAPCALGGVLDDRTADALKARAVVGAANNQLATEDVATKLHRAGVCYVPDFVANAGGLINIASERSGYDPGAVAARVDGIGITVERLLLDAEARGTTPLAAAMQLVDTRLATARALDG